MKDLLEPILNVQITTIVSGIVVFVATFLSFTQVLNKLDVYLNMCQNSAVIEGTENLVYWAYGRNINSGYLKHVYVVLDRLGYDNNPNETNWDLLWAHDYPFRTLYSQLRNLQPHQKVNHFPGCGYITNKVDLSTSGLKYTPPAFKLPNQKEEFLSYAQKNPNKIFIQKSNDHRGIKVEKVEDIDLENGEAFVQEYVDKPFLVDGFKFDIGVYTIITSIDPLRIYIYNGDVLFR